MADIEQKILEANDKRNRAVDKARALIEEIDKRGDGMSADEKRQLDAFDAEVARHDTYREALTSSESASRKRDAINDEFERVATPSEREDRARADAQMGEDILNFFHRGHHSKGVGFLEIDLTAPARIYDHARHGLPVDELRAVIATDTGASGGSLTVPTTVATSIYAYMTASVAMRRIGCTIITTDGGNAMNFPRVATHGIGTQIANQDTAFAGTNPILGQMTLNAFDFGQLVAISSDMLEDSGVDVLGFVTRQIGRAIGQVTATAYVTGSGSGAPQGIQGAVGGAGTIASGGTLFSLPAGQELEKLIDLQYSVVDSYRQNGAAWLMRDLTGARIRKIRDGAGGTAGQFVWQPSPTVGAIGGQPDTFLGDPVYFDPNVASLASDAKTVYYGDWSAYYIRDTRNFRLERSDDLLFDRNQIAFRGILRTDGDLIDTNAINAIHQAVT